MALRITRRQAMAAGALGGMLPLALAGCGGREGSTEAPAAAKGPVTIRYTYRADQSPSFDEFAKAFTQRTPNVTVTTENFPGAEYFTKLSVLFAAGTASDAMWVSSIEAYFDQQSRGNWLAIDPYLKRDKVELKEWFAGAVEMLRVKGALYALPFWAHPSSVALYFNKDVLTQAGIPQPDGSWSFEQALGYAQRLTKDTGSPDLARYGYNPSVAFFNGFCQVMSAFGISAISDDGKKAQLQSPPATAAAQWLADLYLRHRVAPPSGTSLNPLWDSGRVAMRVALYGTRREARVTRPWPINWGANLAPKGPGSYGAQLQTDCNPIYKQSKQPDAAWAFQRFMSGQEIGLKLVQNSFLPGARPDVWNHPDLTKDETHRPFIAVMQSAPPIPRAANGLLNDVSKEVDAAMGPVWKGDVTVSDALADAQRRVQVVLDKPAPSS